ncbi:MAG: 50S ribosomal protein L11 methyltransferase [Myxococcota bacterium]
MALVKLLLDVSNDISELVGQTLIELGAGGVEEQSGSRGARLIVYGDDREQISALAEQARSALGDMGLDEDQGNLSIRIEVDPNSDWDTAWTRHLQQQALTPRWVIQPVWDETPPPEGMNRIVIRPTLAFGDGAHVTTRLAAQAVERFCLALPGASVLDVGTGTGVLAVLAALSGAKTVHGIDIDAIALSAARENAELNGVSELVSFEDAANVEDSGFDMVVANLEPRALLADAARIARRARDARELTLTGFLSDQADGILERFEGFGFKELARVVEEDWCLLVLGKGSQVHSEPP